MRSQPGYLRPVAVVLVRRECYCGQNADDRNYNHQLDQGKALLNRSHGSLLPYHTGVALGF